MISDDFLLNFLFFIIIRGKGSFGPFKLSGNTNSGKKQASKSGKTVKQPVLKTIKPKMVTDESDAKKACSEQGH